LINRLFGGDGEALVEEQTESEARIGMIKREFAEHPSKGLTPAKLYSILEDAERGDLKAQHELFDDMEEKDPQIAADLGKRRQLAAELEWQIVAPDSASAQEKKAAEFCTDIFSGLEVEDLIIDLGAGIGHGWSNLELPWAIDGGKRIIEQPAFRPHSWFRLHPERQNELRLRDLSGVGAALWPLGWVQHRHRAKAGYIARSGLHRVLAWPYLFQNYALGDLAELLEIYGIPARIGTYPRNATDKEKATLLRAVTNLGHRAAGIIPEGMLIDFKDAADGKGDLYGTMLSWCEQAKAKAILGNTLTSGTGEGTNTNALGNVHERGQQSLIRADARQYSGTINRDIVWPMAAINFGIEDRRRAPRFYLDTGEAEDYKLLSDSLPVFVDMGARIPVWWLHEKTRIPRADDKDEILQRLIKPAAPEDQAQLKGLAVLTGDVPATDTAEAQLNRLNVDAEQAMATMLDGVRTLLAEVETLEQFRDRLAEAYPDMDTTVMAELMGKALAAAELAGRYDILEGIGHGG
jgi:phage gp29-like protein